MKRRIDITIIALIALLAGCDSGGQQRPWKTLTECEQANTDMSMQVETLQDENAQLTEQVKTLQELDKSVRFKNLNTLDKVRIGKRAGFYDKDDNGTNDTLVVSLEPTDTAQDTIKAVGKAEIELWDLNKPKDSLVTKWTVEPGELGDVNSDGTIDILDALRTAQYYVGLDPADFNPDVADTNCDESIDIIDALLIAQYYVGLISEFC